MRLGMGRENYCTYHNLKNKSLEKQQHCACILESELPEWFKKKKKIGAR